MRARQYGFLTLFHLSDPLVPAADDLTDSNAELQGLPAVIARVELLAIGKLACVVRNDCCALRAGSTSALGHDLFFKAFCHLSYI